MLALLCLSFVAGALSAPAPSDCSQDCTAQYSPVCASNGHSYSNTCTLSIASCQSQQQGRSPIFQIHTGSCSSGSILGGFPGSSATCDQICDEVRSPLCASDGVVYDNRCLFTVAQCKAARNRTHITIVSYTSTCPTPTQPDCEKYAVNTSDLAIEGPLGGSIKTLCPHSSHEVCTDHGTFRSECQLCQTIESMIAKTQHYPTGYKVPEYKVLYDGPCHTGSSYYPNGPYYPGQPGYPVDPMYPGGGPGFPIDFNNVGPIAV